MLLLGFLSIISATFIPGFIILKLLRQNLAPVTQFIAVFFISIAWTQLKVITLVILSIFNTGVIVAIFAAECSLLVWALTKKQIRPRSYTNVSLILTSIFVVCLIGIFIYIYKSTPYLGPKPFFSVWTHWDSIVSWNRWAKEWAGNHFPSSTWGYGQLIPTLWAYTYVFNFNRYIEFFPKALTDLFPILIIIIHLDLIFKKHILASALSLIGLYFLSKSPVAVWTFQAMADMPLASLVIGSLYFAFTNNTADPRDAKILYALALLTAALAAATKQQGWMLFALSPFIYAPFFPHEITTRKNIFLFCGIGYLIAAPFYIYYVINLIQSKDSVNLKILFDTTTNQSGGASTPISHLIHGLKMWRDSYGNIITYAIIPAIILLSIVLFKTFRRFILLFLIPYALIWAIAFSYDIRNALLIFPILTFLFGLTCEKIILISIKRIFGQSSVPIHFRSFLEQRRMLDLINNVKSLHFVSACFIIIIVIGQFISDHTLINAYEQTSLTKGTPELNSALVSAYTSGLIKPGIITNYEIMVYLPQFENLHPIFRFLKDQKEVTDVLSDKETQTLIIWKNGLSESEWNSANELAKASFISVLSINSLSIFTRRK